MTCITVALQLKGDAGLVRLGRKFIALSEVLEREFAAGASLNKSNPDNQTGTRNNTPAEQKIMQSVVRRVQESLLVHFYLACGHMITMNGGELKAAFPSSIECWACEEETRSRRSVG